MKIPCFSYFPVTVPEQLANMIAWIYSQFPARKNIKKEINAAMLLGHADYSLKKKKHQEGHIAWILTL